MFPRIHSMMAWVEEPGRKTAETPFAWSRGTSSCGMIPPPKT
jgi:hypothetical protein